MILIHPEHGYFVASYSNEVEDMRKLGWIPADEVKPEEQEEVTPIKKTNRRKNGNNA